MQRHIYKLTNTANGRVYYGETTTKKLVQASERQQYGGHVMRLAEHLAALEAGRHYNEYVQAAYDNGETEWTFTVIQTLKPGATKAEALAAEKAWVLSNPSCYNIRHKIGSKTGRNERLSSAEVDQILRLHALGHPGNVIAAMTGRSTASVSLAINNKRPSRAIVKHEEAKREAAALIERAKANPVWRNADRTHLNVKGTVDSLKPSSWLAWHYTAQALSKERAAIEAAALEAVCE